MDSTPTPVPVSPVTAVDEGAVRRRNFSWTALWWLMAFPLWLIGIWVLAGALNFLHLDSLPMELWVLLWCIVVVLLAATMVRRGIKRGWNTPAALRWGWRIAGLLVVVLVGIGVHSFRLVKRSSVDKSVLGNIRQLSAAADQYFLENGVTTCAFSDLVGPDKYVKALRTEAGETYPRSYTQGLTITVTGVAGARTVTYAP